MADDILIVVSKLKSYIKQKADMNTSASVGPVLSELVRRLCDEAIENAKKDGRKTVMDRDFQSSAGGSMAMNQ
jgi:histone H3/H4